MKIPIAMWSALAIDLHTGDEDMRVEVNTGGNVRFAIAFDPLEHATVLLPQVPETYNGGNLGLLINYSLPSGDHTGEEADFVAVFEAITPGDAVALESAESFGTNNNIVLLGDANGGRLQIHDTGTLAELDGLAIGDQLRIYLGRDGSGTVSGRVLIYGITLYEVVTEHKVALPINSSVTTGTAPFTIASTTKVANLNAERFCGANGSTIAKGGIIGGDGTGTAAILPISSNIEAVLQPDSSQSTGLKWRVGSELTLPLPVGYMTGFSYTNNSADLANDIDIYSGQCRDSNANATNIRLNWSPIVKRLDAAWAEGTNQGGLDTGSKAANTWYSIWAIKDISRNYVDCLFSASQYDPTMPSGFGYRRRIGWIRTDASGNIRLFDFRNGWVNWLAPLLDIDTTSLSTTRTHYSLATSIPPLDVEYRTTEFEADMMISGAALRKIYLSNPDMADYAPSDTAVPLASLRMAVAGQPAGGTIRMIANREPKISARSDGASTIFRVSVRGFRDPRGQYDGFY